VVEEETEKTDVAEEGLGGGCEGGRGRTGGGARQDSTVLVVRVMSRAVIDDVRRKELNFLFMPLGM
jgi:hypothetical protein